MTSNWFADRLGTTPAPAPAAPGPRQDPGALPPHLAPYAQPSAYSRPAAPTAPPTGPPVYQPEAAPPGGYKTYNANGQLVADDGSIEKLQQTLQHGNSQKVMANSHTCPECSSGNYFTVEGNGNTVFSRSAGGVVKPMLCADCGYPAPKQAGSQGGALHGQTAKGPVGTARQLAYQRQVVVVDPETRQTLVFDSPDGRH
jgi:hypothetical protein